MFRGKTCTSDCIKLADAPWMACRCFSDHWEIREEATSVSFYMMELCWTIANQPGGGVWDRERHTGKTCRLQGSALFLNPFTHADGLGSHKSQIQTPFTHVDGLTPFTMTWRSDICQNASTWVLNHLIVGEVYSVSVQRVIVSVGN